MATPSTRKLMTRSYDLLELDRQATKAAAVPSLIAVASSSSHGIGGV